ncbi:hypothetical protein EJB05_36138, partial [Eragrostis curvula]
WLDLRTVATVSALSRRWRHLPHLLSDIRIDASDLLSIFKQTDQIMAAYTDATKWLLLPNIQERTIRSMSLGFYLKDPYLRRIGDLVGDAIDSVKTELLEFIIPVDVAATDFSAEDKLLFGQRFLSFFDACPKAFGCLTRLTLEDLSFGAPDDDIPTLLKTCKKLRFLALKYCDFGDTSTLVIEHSELLVLRLDYCTYDRIDLIRFPKLEQVCCDTWYGDNPPVTFGHVPRLHHIAFGSNCLEGQEAIVLSEWLSNAKNLSSLYLNFRDQMIWVKPEDPKQLISIFRNLRDVQLYSIFQDCDLNWTLFILEAAPFLKNLYVTICRHICGKTECEYSAEKTSVQWEASNFQHQSLSLLQIQGFAVEKKVMQYIRLVIQHAVCLKRIRLLKQLPCKICDAINRRSLFPVIWKFPVRESEKDFYRERLRDGLSSSAEICIEG